MSDLPVLISGAGPTGLALALNLARRGVTFRLLDENAGPGEHSRAMAVQARTLEFYRQFGIAEEVVNAGVIVRSAHLRTGSATERGEHERTVQFTEIGAGLSPYPFALAYPQDDHERFLVAKLRDMGVEVERNAKVTGLVADTEGASVTVTRGDGSSETIRASYVCGCDGAHSAVRQSLGIGFSGGTYDQMFYVADVKTAQGWVPDLYLNLGSDILVLMLPVRSSGMQRLIGLVPPELTQKADLNFDDIRGRAEALLGVTIEQLNWFSAYHVHHRVADRFRQGCAFLLGDAGHVHSPVGGQGMNTGIGDAMDLGWKLASVVRGRAPDALLDTYEPERIAFARKLVATTDRAFTAIIAEGPPGEAVRRLIMPMFFTIATRFAWSRHAMFRLLSQTEVHYAESALSEGKAGEVHGGDRLPWVNSNGADNFAPLRSLDWQVHVYGTAEPGFASACADLGLPLETFTCDEVAEGAGLRRDAAYLVRPDGYVGLALERQDGAALRATPSATP